ncbi:bifunctional AP-4-A phosphorylase/ADP sulfurylase [Ascosphaera pollenicola]|nr:bifunctional AP-4-A phosphorylase/ADP sulfurylase [Ascosphaera pollenicola]
MAFNNRSSFSSNSSQPWSASSNMEPPELPTLDPRYLAHIPLDAAYPPSLLAGDCHTDPTNSDGSYFAESMGFIDAETPLTLSASHPDMSQDAGFMSNADLMNHYYNESAFDAEGGLQLFDVQSQYPPLPLPEPSLGLGIYGQTTDFSGSDASFTFAPTQGDMVGSYAPQAFQLMDVVAPEALAACSGDVQPAPQLAHPPVVPSSQDLNLLEGRRLGLTYKQIKEQYGMPESESTLRGRYRSLTKPKEERVRKPVWLPNDIRLLKEAVEALRVVHNGTESVSWVRVAERMRERGSSYCFANATCKKKWEEVSGKARK